MYFQLKGISYIRLSTTNNIIIYKDTNINGDALLTGRLDVGQNTANSTNWINLHTDNTNGNGSVGYMKFTTWGGRNCTWDITSSATDVKT